MTTRRISVLAALVAISALVSSVSGAEAINRTTTAPGTIAAAGTTTGTTTVHWGSPTTVPLRGQPIDISCPTAAFCMIVDESGRAVTVRNGHRTVSDVIAASGFVSVSCAAEKFCMAGSARGVVFVYRGGSWHRSVQLHHDAVRVSCGSTTFCLAAAGHRYQAYRGGQWGPVRTIARHRAAFTDVSCAATTCGAIAVKWNGTTSLLPTSYGYRWRGHAMGSGAVLKTPSDGPVEHITCTSKTFCFATYGVNGGYLWNGRRWRATDSAGESEFNDVSCVSPRFCMVVSDDLRSRVIATHGAPGSGWSRAHEVMTAVLRRPDVFVSCSSAKACTTVDHSGDVRSWTGKWGPVRVLDPTSGTDEFGSLTVSCGAPRLCMAFDEFDNYLVHTSSGWTRPRPISPTARGMLRPSCVDAHFCLAVDATGRSWIYNGTTWRKATAVRVGRTGALGALVSCGSTTFCAAVFGFRFMSVFDGHTWSRPRQVVNRSAGIIDLSCTTHRSCALVAARGNKRPQLLDYRSGTWKSSITIPLPSWSDPSISCASATRCLVTDGDNRVLARRGDRFHVLATAGDVAAASCISVNRCVLDEYRSYQIYDGATLEQPQPLTDDTSADDWSISCAAPSTCATGGSKLLFGH